jgi:hypothetical protein
MFTANLPFESTPTAYTLFVPIVPKEFSLSSFVLIVAPFIIKPVPAKLVHDFIKLLGVIEES